MSDPSASASHRPGRVMRALGLLACLCTASLAVLTSCASENTTGAGSQSNWLTCKEGVGCPSDLQCECGLCTRACDAHNECSDLHARASCEATADVQVACKSPLPTQKRICVLGCLDDSDCVGSGLLCREGTCIPVASAAPLDASMPDASDGATTERDTAASLALDVQVAITADNAYGFGYGTSTGLRNYFGGVSNLLAEEIFTCGEGLGPETYTVPAADAQPGDTLYIIAWADSTTTQGVLGEFRRSGQAAVYTGEGNWTVCATGVRFDSSTSGPDMLEINRQIGLCNAGTTDPSTTSAGWVDSAGTAAGALAIGESNDTDRGPNPETGNEFPIACGIAPEARWMWFNWDPANISWPAQTPFVFPASTSSANPDKQFLIFRLAADEVQSPL